MSEEKRAYYEAKAVLRMPKLARQAYLLKVEEHRGKVRAEKLKADVMELWDKKEQ